MTLCAAWSIFEFATGGTMWGMIAAAFTAYAVWQFFYLYKPEGQATAEGAPPEGKE